MTRLSQIAERQRCAIIAVRHLTKGGKDRAIYRGIGSIDFTAACRSVLLVGCDPDNPSQRAIVHIKSNLAEVGEAIGYTIRDGSFSWTGASNLTADRIFASASKDDERSTTNEAQDFLREVLADGPQPATEIQKQAQAIGISDSQIRTARTKLGIKPRKQGQPGKKGQQWVWELSGCNEVAMSSEDVSEKDSSHLRANNGPKGFAPSRLAEDETASTFSHLRDLASHLQKTAGATFSENSLLSPESESSKGCKSNCDHCGADVLVNESYCAACGIRLTCVSGVSQ